MARSYNRSNYSNQRNSGNLIVLIRYSGKVCVISPPPVVTNIAICRQTSVKSPVFFADVHAAGAELLYADRRTDGRT
jgi:hypothetical protein